MAIISNRQSAFINFLVLLSSTAAFAAVPLAAQVVTGTLGDPSATTTIAGNQLPAPPPQFGGVIKPSAVDSKPWWQPRVVPPKGAPNVLLIMTDDQGYGVPGTFGGVVPTPALDRIAKSGLRYTQFHSTAMCSPTRAALITGRNHHSVGFGVIGELSTGFPGYDSVIGKDTATVAKILKNNGYATSWFGKDHNTPLYQLSAAGPFDQWPVGMGFDYFYGYMGGETDQFTPYLFRNTTVVTPWIGKPDYNLSTDLADDAIRYMRDMRAVAPNQPTFIYYVPSGSHAPHQPPREWVEKFKGKFDMGWNVLRAQIFANQKWLGVIPADAKLTPWPKQLPTWESLTPVQKRLYARQAEVFAAYTAYTDHEIGRVIQEVEDEGKLDNTLIIYIDGDNGTSAEGTLDGTYNVTTAYNGILKVPEALQVAHMPFWGDERTAPHMSVGWAWAFDTPFQWTKQVASHFGGTRQGMAISWPGHITDVGGVRTQFHHVIDVVPTILEVAGIRAPDMVDGIKQKPIEGISMAYTFDKANANAPSRRTTQYFEMLGNRAIYHDGWVAATTPAAPPWVMGTGKMPEVVNGYQWELYNLATDYSQADDLARQYPEKLKAMQALFLSEAAKHQVLPLDNSLLSRAMTARPSPLAGESVISYTGPTANIPPSNAPSILDKNYTITADITVPKGGAEGVIVTEGGRFGGYALLLTPSFNWWLQSTLFKMIGFGLVAAGLLLVLTGRKKTWQPRLGYGLLVVGAIGAGAVFVTDIFGIGKGRPVFVYNLLDLERFRWAGLSGLGEGKHRVVFDFHYDGPGLGKGGTGLLSVDGKEVARKSIKHSVPIMFSPVESFDVGSDMRTPVDFTYESPFVFTGTIEKLTFQLGPSQATAPADQAEIAAKQATAAD